MSTNLSTQFLKEMHSALLEEQAKLEKELSKFTNHATGREDYTVMIEEVGNEEGENAVEVAQFGDNLSLEEELSSALDDVSNALLAHENGTYGTCKYCKQAISEDRLRIRPTSTSCVACKKTLTQEL
jgi:RNA polymerase-binding transcription factor DksA